MEQTEYTLKRDLPFAKAGKKLAVMGIHVVYWTSEGKTFTAYPVCDVDEVEKLISDGWIEEKSRTPKSDYPSELRYYYHPECLQPHTVGYETENGHRSLFSMNCNNDFYKQIAETIVRLWNKEFKIGQNCK